MARAAIGVAGFATRYAILTAFVFEIVLGSAARPVGAQETTAPTSAVVRDESSVTDATAEKKKKAGGASFLPIPIFITEPAIGVGLGAALAYFHETAGDTGDEAAIPSAMSAGTPGKTGRKKKRPPTISAVAGAYADSGTWGGGFLHSRSNRRDSVRYKGALGYADVKSTVYFFNLPFAFDIKGGILFQDIKFRLGKSNVFLGGKLSALSAKTDIKLGLDVPIKLGEGDTTDVGLAAQVIWETRDNVMTPSHGQLIQLDAWRYDDALGGDYDYWDLNFKINSFHELDDLFVLGWRVDVKAIDGEPPFWGYPWIALRGVPAMRYQNERVGVVEVEGRYNFAKRWGAVGFLGRGRTDGDIPAFETEDRIIAGGIGGRFLFKPDESLWVGIDIARGPEDVYWYVQVGQAW